MAACRSGRGPRSSASGRALRVRALRSACVSVRPCNTRQRIVTVRRGWTPGCRAAPTPPAPWRIHEIAPDFRLEDVWALPTPGGPDGLRSSVEGFGPRVTLPATDSRLVRILASRSAGRSGRSPAGTARTPALRARERRRSAIPAAGGSARRPLRADVPDALPLQTALPARATSGPPRSPTGPCTACSTSAGSRSGGWRLPRRPDGRAG